MQRACNMHAWIIWINWKLIIIKLLSWEFSYACANVRMWNMTTKFQNHLFLMKFCASAPIYHLFVVGFCWFYDFFLFLFFFLVCSNIWIVMCDSFENVTESETALELKRRKKEKQKQKKMRENQHEREKKEENSLGHDRQVRNKWHRANNTSDKQHIFNRNAWEIYIPHRIDSVIRFTLSLSLYSLLEKLKKFFRPFFLFFDFILIRISLLICTFLRSVCAFGLWFGTSKCSQEN